MDVTYSELSTEDAEALIKLRLSVMETNPYSFSVTKQEEIKTGKEIIRQVIHNYELSNERIIIGAWEQGLIGVVGVERYSGEIEKHKVRLWGPYVEKSSREQGIGETLVKKAMDYAFGIEGVEIITLETGSESRRAISIFDKQGFVKTGTQINALKFDDKYIDLIYMQRQKST